MSRSAHSIRFIYFWNKTENPKRKRNLKAFVKLVRFYITTQFFKFNELSLEPVIYLYIVWVFGFKLFVFVINFQFRVCLFFFFCTTSHLVYALIMMIIIHSLFSLFTFGFVLLFACALCFVYNVTLFCVKFSSRLYIFFVFFPLVW